MIFFCAFSTQNGQTAKKVAEGASHQDIIDLLKAHAKASSTADLLWARLTTFTSCHPDLVILQLFCLPSGEKQTVELGIYVFHNVAIFFFHVFANMPCVRP